MAINYAELRNEFRAERKQGVLPLKSVILAIILALSTIFTLNTVFGAENVDIDMSIIAQIESSNNPMAYNKRSGATGLCQITLPTLADFNARHNTRVTMDDLYNPQVNMRIANWYMNTKIPQYLKAYKLADTLKNRLWAYNAGIGRVKQGILPDETRDYIAKYKQLKKGG